MRPLGNCRRSETELAHPFSLGVSEDQHPARICSFQLKILRSSPKGAFRPGNLLLRLRENAAQEIAPPCRTGELGCVDCKMKLAKNLNEALRPIREKRIDLLKRPDFVWDVLLDGASRARSRAQSVMAKVHDHMKMNYRKKA